MCTRGIIDIIIIDIITTMRLFNNINNNNIVNNTSTCLQFVLNTTITFLKMYNVPLYSDHMSVLPVPAQTVQ